MTFSSSSIASGFPLNKCFVVFYIRNFRVLVGKFFIADDPRMA